MSIVPGPGTWDVGSVVVMKSQDIGVLLKLVCLQRQEMAARAEVSVKAWPHDWQDWSEENAPEHPDEVDLAALPVGSPSLYTARALELQTGISKTQINRSLKHCMDIGLAREDRKLGVPRANTRVLLEFIVHGLKYVFPARAGELTRGIGTSFAAPVLAGRLLSAGEHLLVWPDAYGNTKGLKVEPLFKTATYAAKRDPEMYALMALIDAIRLGQPRESNLATSLLKERLEIR